MKQEPHIRDRLRSAAQRLPSPQMELDQITRRGRRLALRVRLLKGIGVALALTVFVLGVVAVTGGNDGGLETASSVDPNSEQATMPELSDAVTVTVQAQAIAEACRAVLCSGAPIYLPESTSPALRSSIRERFTDEAQYVDSITIEERTGSDGLFEDGATLIDAGGVVPTETANLVAVDVKLSRGFRSFERRTFLFEWNGNEWRPVTVGESPVTVTTSSS